MGNLAVRSSTLKVCPGRWQDCQCNSVLLKISPIWDGLLVWYCSCFGRNFQTASSWMLVVQRGRVILTYWIRSRAMQDSVGGVCGDVLRCAAMCGDVWRCSICSCSEAMCGDVFSCSEVIASNTRTAVGTSDFLRHPEAAKICQAMSLRNRMG